MRRGRGERRRTAPEWRNKAHASGPRARSPTFAARVRFTLTGGSEINDIITTHDAAERSPLGLDYAAPMEAPRPGAGVAILPVLRQYWKSIAAVALAITAIGAGTIWCFVKPNYEVTASIHVSPVVRPVLFSDSDTDISRNYRQYVGTEASNVTSPAAIEDALDVPEVRELALVKSSLDPVAEIASRLTVGPIPNTELLKVAMTGDKPREMVTIINSLIQTYLRRRHEQQRDWDERILGSLKREETELETKLEIKARQLHQTAVDKGLGGAEPSGQMLDTWIAELQQLATQARKDQALATGRLQALEAGGAATSNPGELDAYMTADPGLRTLREQERNAQLAVLNDDRLGRGPNHPDVQGRTQLLAEVTDRIKEREASLLEQFRDSIKRKLLGELRDAEVTAKVLAEELRRLSDQRSEVAGQLFVLENLRHERQRLEESLNQVRAKVWNVEVEQNRVPRITIDSMARVPLEPNKDRRPHFTAACVMFGLFAGVALAFLRARADTRFHHPLQVTERLGVRVLGTVQHVEDEKLLVNPTDHRIVEPIRAISAALVAAHNARSTRVRLITSPTAGSGKSSLALNLARNLAATGRKVLLVDADNDVQGVTRRLKLRKLPGLSELLDGRVAPQQAVHACEGAGPQVLPSGKHDPRFGEWLSRVDAQAKLRELFQSFDEVLVDSPPVLAKSDVMILATLVDEVVLVVRADQTTREEALGAQQQLASVGANVVGAVLNGVDPQSRPYGYAYAYQYGYLTPEPELVGETAASAG